LHYAFTKLFAFEKDNRANYATSFRLFAKCCNSAFEKVIVLKENAKINRN